MKEVNLIEEPKKVEIISEKVVLKEDDKQKPQSKNENRTKTETELEKKSEKLFKKYSMEELHEKAVLNNPQQPSDNIIFLLQFKPEELHGFTKDERKRIDKWRHKTNELFSKQFGGDQTESQIEHSILIIQDKDSESNREWDELYEMYAIEELCDKAASNNPHIKHDIIINMLFNNPDELNGFSQDERDMIDEWRFKAKKFIKPSLGQSEQQIEREDHIKNEESFFDTQEFEELEKEFACDEETLGEEKDQIDTKEIQPLVVENLNDQSQKTNINVVSEFQTIKSEVFFI